MNVNRRNVFGILGGGAVAAPSVAKKIAEGIGGSGPEPGGYPIGGSLVAESTAGSVQERDWLPGRIQELKAQLSGERPIAPRHQRPFRHVEAARIDGLRSVSASNKARMLIEWQEGEDHEQSKAWWQNELKHLLERAGIVGLLLK